MDNEDKMREEFEEWISHYIGESWLELYKFRMGEYLDNNIQSMWEAWQASRSALYVNLSGYVHNNLDGGFICEEGAKAMLEEAGVNYK